MLLGSLRPGGVTETRLALHGLAIWAIALATSACAQGPGREASLIQLRLARNGPAPGFEFMHAPPPLNGVYVDERTVLSDDDIEQARAYVRPNGLVVSIVLTQDGASRLANLTRQHVGDRLAVILDGELVDAPLVVDTTQVAKHRRLQVGVELPDSVAHRLTARLAARWPLLPDP